MDREEAALRAKIQAVKNLLAVKQRTYAYNLHSYRKPAVSSSYTPYHARKTTPPVHKTWTRSTTAPPSSATVSSANRVWVNKDAVRSTPLPPPPVTTQPPSMSFAQRVRNRMQLQMLRLEDGEYAKANGGFSLVRSDVMKAKAEAKAAPVIQRTSLSIASTANRARAVVARAHAAARGKPKITRVRTEYCRFFNKFGFCNNKNACKFLHDSRRVTLCRKFGRGVCDNPNCLLSHDKNKMPVCTLFLRGACTRDNCRFRHVKVSGSAQVCDAFLNGYCSMGAACPMKHEQPKGESKKRSFSSIANESTDASPAKHLKIDTTTSVPGTSSWSPVAVPSSSSASSSPSSVTSATTKSPLSIRPNIRFTPRHPGGALPSLLSLRKKQPSLPTYE